MAAGLSQRDLADVLGISVQQLQKYETGVNGVSAAMLYQIAAILNVEIGMIFDDVPTLKLN